MCLGRAPFIVFTGIIVQKNEHSKATHVSESQQTPYVVMALTHPSNPNVTYGSELSNAAAISPSRYIIWPTSVSIHNKTLNGGKIHGYNYIHEIAKTPILQRHHLFQ